jgi:hypothetical protein
MTSDKLADRINDLKIQLTDFDINYHKFDWRLTRGLEELLYKVTDEKYNGLIIDFAAQTLSPEIFNQIMENMIQYYTVNLELRNSRMAIWQLMK